MRNTITSFLSFVSLFVCQSAIAQQDGLRDTSFNHDGIFYNANAGSQVLAHPAQAQRILSMPDGNILISTSSMLDPSEIPALAKQGFTFCLLNKDGMSLDIGQYGTWPYYYTGFRFIKAPDGYQAADVSDIQLLPNGQVLVSATVLDWRAWHFQTTFKLNYPSLTIDTTYGVHGLGQLRQDVAQFSTGRSAVMPDGSVYSAAWNMNYFGDSLFHYVIKRKPNGMLDSSWQHNGFFQYWKDHGVLAADLSVSSGGYIYSCGQYMDSVQLRHIVVLKQLPNGNLDTSYGDHGIAMVGYIAHNMLLNSDGSVYLNSSTPVLGGNSSAIIKLKPNGRPDSSFGVNGVSIPATGFTLQYGATDMLRQADGKILMIGSSSAFTTAGGTMDSAWVAVWRVQPNGKMDSTFGVNGIGNYHIMPDVGGLSATAPVRVANGGALQSDGRLLLAGTVLMANTVEMVAMRLNNKKPIQPSGIAGSPANNYNLKVFPVPVQNELHITYTLHENDFTQMRLVDMNGRTVAIQSSDIQSPGTYNTVLNVSGLTSGVYLLDIRGKQTFTTVRVLIQ